MTTGSRRWFGAVLAAVLCAGFPADASAQKVAIMAADLSGVIDDVRSKLIAAGVTDVTIISVADLPPTSPTPTLVELQQYDAIFTWSNYGYVAPAALGNVLAAYVDQGGGVVQAVFSLNVDTPARLDGRWRTEAYEPFQLARADRNVPLSLVATQPLHPILSGVTSFNGGIASFHHATVPQGCAELVAQWSNGRPLVAARVGPHGGRIIGLNFYPHSDSILPGYWDSRTDGGVLMANALRFAATPVTPVTGPVVALLAADTPDMAADVRCKLQQTQLFSRVDIIDVRSMTPTLASLLPYPAVLTWSNSSYGDSAALGNVLSDYVDQDHGVVQAVSRLDGRWGTGGYRPFTAAPIGEGASLTLVAEAAGHVILSGVDTFGGGTRSFHSAPVFLDAATTLVASWSNGQPLVATGAGPTAGRIVGLNMLPPSNDARPDLWDHRTDGARLIANTLLFAANHAPVADAGGDQTIEATSSSGASFILNGTASDPDGDSPLTFAWSGAGSASGPAITVDAPAPVAPGKTQTFTVTLTVSDGKGGEDTDSVELTVRDSMGPVLDGVPSGVVTADAAGPDGVAVGYGPVTATDAVDGARSVDCSHASGSVFPVGDTLVTCSSSDSRENTTSATFIVRVSGSDAAAPGQVYGYGFMRADRVHHEFVFAASENAAGRDHGGLLLNVKTEVRGHRGRITWRHDTFVAKTADAVTFTGGSTVLFSGVGRWNGRAGYRYEVFAVDQGRPGRGHHDTVRITITAPGGAIAAHVDAVLTGGNVQFVPLAH